MKAITRITHRIIAALSLLAFSATSVLAALPAAVAPSNNPAAGNWLELIRGYVRDGGVVLGLTVSVLGFIWIAYTGISKFNEARNGKAEWAEVGLLGIVGGALLLFVTYLLTEAAAVI
ncbi:MAG: TIGR03745 family integrating conjugative element membrane protein [Chromatiales bacterium]|nr:TIGR03745 family integrating conjugative element membrane protein [Gammaproteobacteria bacterium]